MAFSLLHTSFLNDSDSMKIKLENLAIFESQDEKPPAWNRRRLASVFLSLAALLLVGFFLMPSEWLGGQSESQNAIAKQHSWNTVEVTGLQKASDNLNSWNAFRENFGEIQIYPYSAYPESYSSIGSFSVLTVCLDWLQKSFLHPTESERSDVDQDQIYRIYQNVGTVFVSDLT